MNNKKLISDDLNVEERLKRLKINDIEMTMEQLENETEPIQSRLEAEAALRKVGVHVLGKTGGDVLLLAACHGLLNVVKFLDGPSQTIHHKNSFGDSLLHFAAKGGQAKMCMYLLFRGLNPMLQNKFNETPIFLAAENGHIDVVNILIKDPRTNLEHQDKFGDTVLHFAARDGQLEICDMLMRKSKKVARIKNQEGKTPLSYALDNGQSAVAQCLRNYDAPAAYGDRQQCIQELAIKMMNEFPDYKKSIFKHVPTKVTLFGKKQTREELIAEQNRVRLQAEQSKRAKEKSSVQEKEKQEEVEM